MQCSATSFRLNNANVAAFTMAKTGTLCSEDYITIEGISFFDKRTIDFLGHLFFMVRSN